MYYYDYLNVGVDIFQKSKKGANSCKIQSSYCTCSAVSLVLLSKCDKGNSFDSLGENMDYYIYFGDGVDSF